AGGLGRGVLPGLAAGAAEVDVDVPAAQILLIEARRRRLDTLPGHRGRPEPERPALLVGQDALPRPGPGLDVLLDRPYGMDGELSGAADHVRRLSGILHVGKLDDDASLPRPGER